MRKHGHYSGYKKSKTFYSWRSMMNRCHNAGTINYDDYGGKGIKVCDRWHKFANFLEDMGTRPENTTLHRVKSDVGYEPGNCVWADDATQKRYRSKSIFITKDGITKPLAQWCAELGIAYKTAHLRWEKGKSAEEILKPVDQAVSDAIRTGINARSDVEPKSG